MLAQLEDYREKSKEEREHFLGMLSEVATTTIPFYRIFPHYFDQHKQELSQWKRSLETGMNLSTANLAQVPRRSKKDPVTRSRSSPDRRESQRGGGSSSTDKRLKRSKTMDGKMNSEYDAILSTNDEWVD